jgi:hypothetical protein
MALGLGVFFLVGLTFLLVFDWDWYGELVSGEGV